MDTNCDEYPVNSFSLDFTSLPVTPPSSPRSTGSASLFLSDINREENDSKVSRNDNLSDHDPDFNSYNLADNSSNGDQNESPTSLSDDQSTNKSDSANSDNSIIDNSVSDDGEHIDSDDEFENTSSSAESLKRKKKKSIGKRVNKKKKTKHNDNVMQSIMAELLAEAKSEPNLDGDLSTQMLMYLQEINWKSNLSNDETIELEPLYNKICEEISIVPKIGDILRLSMPYDEKCDLIEKILILYNAQPNTFEFLQLKRNLNKTIEKYKLFSMSEHDYEKYKKIEDSLTMPEKKFKPLKYQILDSNMSNTNKAFVYQKYKYFSTLDNSNSEYNKLKQWLETVMSLPTEMKLMRISSDDSSHKINKYLWTVKNRLDKEIFGLESVKEKILFLLNNRITNNNSKGLSFALCGPPGTAKTSIINTLSKAIDLPFFQINLGGAKDVSFLSGHGYTYEGAIPGVIVQALTTLKYKNGIIYFDEFDKISNSLHGIEISRMLLHITDFSQNDKFHDRYLSNGIDIDLSNIWFIYSLNEKELLDKTLCDRIPIIFVDGYDKHEKFQIAQNYIIPKSLENINLSKKQVIFSDSAIRYIITLSEKNQDKNTKSGVRQIKHIVDNILMKINLLKTIFEYKNKSKYNLKLSFDIANFKLPIVITEDIIDCLKIDTIIEENLSYKNMYM